MKKIITLFCFFVFVLNISLFAQNGRPGPIENNAPKIGVRNENDPTKIELAKLNERLNALEAKVASLESENTFLKTQTTPSLQKQITDLSGAQKANYIILDNAVTQLKNKFASQVGNFIIKDVVVTKFTGFNNPVHVLCGRTLSD